MKDKIDLILKSGANVVLTTKGIDDLSLKYFVEAGAMAVRRCRKEDLKYIAKATGGINKTYITENVLTFLHIIFFWLTTATMQLTLSDLEGGESFDPANLGFAEEVVQERLADEELIVVKASSIR